MSDPPVLTRIENRTAVLSFNRPHVMNAFDSGLIAATHKAMADLNADPQVAAIVVHGEGRCFSAGFDMKESAAKGISGEEAWRKVLMADFDFIMQFWESPKPTIAAAHGFCIAGAMEVLMACDLAVASEETLMGEPEVRFGSGIVAMLAPYATGPKQAKELLLTGNDRISAQRVLEMGLINRVVAEGRALDAAMTLAAQITSASESSVRKTKRAINRTYELARMHEGLAEALEIDVGIEADMSPERVEFNRIRALEGLKAALEWRSRNARY